jgi:hypothetical protein
MAIEEVKDKKAEYPKALIKLDAGQHKGVTVNTKAEEEKARKDGFISPNELHND